MAGNKHESTEQSAVSEKEIAELIDNSDYSAIAKFLNEQDNADAGYLVKKVLIEKGFAAETMQINNNISEIEYYAWETLPTIIIAYNEEKGINELYRINQGQPRSEKLA